MGAPKLEFHFSYLGVTLYIELRKGPGRKKVWPHWVKISQIAIWGFIIKMVIGS